MLQRWYFTLPALVVLAIGARSAAYRVENRFDFINRERAPQPFAQPPQETRLGPANIVPATPSTAAPTTPTTTAAASTQTVVTTTSLRKAAGATYFVSPDGDDNADGSQSRPWQKVAVAASRLKAGDVLYLRGGTYQGGDNEVISLKGIEGTPDRWTIITAFPGEKPVVKTLGWWHGFEVLESSYIEISNLEIGGSARTDQRFANAIEFRRTHHVKALNNVIYDVGGCGVCSIESNHIHIEANEIFGTSNWNPFQASGISLFQSKDVGGGNNPDGFSNYVLRNRVHGNANVNPPGKGLKITDGNCIIFDESLVSGYTGASIASNNLCFNNGGRGIHVLRSADVVATNNTLVNNMLHPDMDGGELTAAFSRNVTFRNNLVKTAVPGELIANWDTQKLVLGKQHVSGCFTTGIREERHRRRNGTRRYLSVTRRQPRHQRRQPRRRASG